MLTVHCKWNGFGEWSSCSITCGYGEQKRIRLIETAAANGGRNCSRKETETRPCNIKCPGKIFFVISFKSNSNSRVLLSFLRSKIQKPWSYTPMNVSFLYSQLIVYGMHMESGIAAP